MLLDGLWALRSGTQSKKKENVARVPAHAALNRNSTSTRVASIGAGFLQSDHGTGVRDRRDRGWVGERVRVYQAVTLGRQSVSPVDATGALQKALARATRSSRRRVIYAGATTSASITSALARYHRRPTSGSRTASAAPTVIAQSARARNAEARAPPGLRPVGEPLRAASLRRGARSAPAGRRKAWAAVPNF